MIARIWHRWRPAVTFVAAIYALAAVATMAGLAVLAAFDQI